MNQEREPRSLTMWTLITDYAKVHTSNRDELLKYLGEAILHCEKHIVVIRNGKVMIDAHLDIKDEEP